MYIVRQKNGRLKLLSELNIREGETYVREVPNELAQEFVSEGIKWGDIVAWVTKHMGIKQCAPCKSRQEILNKIGELGVAEVIRQMKATMK